jgi:YD repeat-containing protein
LGLRPHLVKATNQSSVPLASGESRVSLPDGRALLLGGIDASGHVVATATFVDQSGIETVAFWHLGEARAFHTATMLPDGRVLVLGGGAAGTSAASAEVIDPATGLIESVTVPAAFQRSHHSTTLLTDGSLVIAGGLAADGSWADTVSWDTRSNAWSAWHVPPEHRRHHHDASLDASGDILIEGGVTSTTHGPSHPDRYHIATRTVTNGDGTNVPAGIVMAESRPSNGATDVSVDTRIAIRFATSMAVGTLNPSTVILRGLEGAWSARIVPAEAGRLLFVTPDRPFDPGSPYELTIEGARDRTGNAIAEQRVSFSTAGERPASADTDEDGGPSAVGSHWRKLPPLRAAAGTTALSGQVLRLNGAPLAGVTVELEGHKATTDVTGRFLLQADDEATGWYELWIDGRSTHGRGVTYGTYEAAVRLAAGKTTVLPFTIWMTRIDTKHAVTIPSPTTQETVVTTPAIPGLELRLPAGAVIRDHDGRVARTISITPIPLDRPPFPLPAGVDVPIYFTVQPGGAYVEVSGTSGYRRGARLIYPNYKGRPAGTPMEFWHYDPEDGRGWYVYGRGAVTANGQQVAPDRGVSIYEFTGAMVAPPTLAHSSGPAVDPKAKQSDGDPVDLGTGLFVLNNTDLQLPDVLPITLQRTYRQNDTISRSFGIGTSQAYDILIVGTTHPYTYVDIIMPDGARVHYDRISTGTSYSDAIYEHTSSGTAFFKSRIAWNGDGWNLDLKDGSRIVFPDAESSERPAQAAATRLQDRYGNVIKLVRNNDGDLTQITSPNGRWIALTYDATHRVTQARDNIDRVVQYTYDTAGRLWKVTDVQGGVTEYTYDAADRMRTIKDARGIVYLTNEYDDGGRVITQTQADGSTFHFGYTLNGTGGITQTEVTNPRGFLRRVTFNSVRYVTADTRAVGQPEQQTITYEWEPATNFLLATVDALNRRTAYKYDDFGNRASVTRLAGTLDAVTYSYKYEPGFQQIASVTDPLNHKTSFEYDTHGSLTKVHDPLNHDTQLGHNAAGQVTSITDALSHRIDLGYDGGDLVQSTDPLGRVTSRFVDGAGRIASVTDGLGQMTRYEYNVQNRLTNVIDAIGGQTSFAYDPNGRVLSLTDALTHPTTYTYDTSDRMATRTDPLTHAEQYQYDANDNPTQVTDRKSQVTRYTYDALDRVGQVTFEDTSTITYTYDAGSRVRQIADSANGTTMREYDGLDRLMQETTPQGTVTYTYDIDGRRATMTVTGQATVTYHYDDAHRLTSVMQGALAVALTYSDTNRRHTVTLPNGIVTTYTWDVASQLASLTYTNGGNTLGSLTYTYDAVGNRASVGGTWARTGVPQAVVATYDSANRLMQWGGTTLSYDLNGNLASDGATNYTWNVRDELSGLSGSVSASFSYDGTGRRRDKTINGTNTKFLYDGLNFVQEQSADGTPIANVLTGLGVDELWARTDNGGTSTVLTDGLGSTIELANGSGALETHYTFQPFGNTSASGSSSTNSTQFTGRENDGTGLYLLPCPLLQPGPSAVRKRRSNALPSGC